VRRALTIWHPDLFLSIHHASVPDNLKEPWQYGGKKNYYSDRFSGYAIFVSNDNADRAGSLAFGHWLSQELQKRGLHYAPHYSLPVMGRFRHELVDPEAGVYRYDHLIVLQSTFIPAVLLEAGASACPAAHTWGCAAKRLAAAANARASPA